MTFTILWDNDGVLVDTEGLFFDATRTILRKVGIELTQAQYIEASLKRGTTNFDLAAERGVGPDTIRQLRAERDELYSASLRARKCLIDGVEDAIRQLHGRVRMGVVTSSRRVHFDIAHAQTGLAPFFDFVLAREDYERAKPHPEPYLTALNRFRLHPDRCVVIEDSERGLSSAAAAGVRCLVIPSDWTAGGDFRKAWKVLDSIAAVPAEVLSLLPLAPTIGPDASASS